MTVDELQEMLESLDFDVKDGKLCFEDADYLAKMYCSECLESEIEKMRSWIIDGTVSGEKERTIRIFIEETTRIRKMVCSSTSWRYFINNLRGHVNHLETCVKEVFSECDEMSFNPSDYINCAEYWLSVLE